MTDAPKMTEAEVSQELQQLSGWELRDGWLRKKFGTPGWTHTMMLANTIAYLAEAAWHHPDLELGYAQVVVKLQTHRVGGLTMLDFALARKIDEVALWYPEEASPLTGFPKKWVHGRVPSPRE